VLTFGGTRRIFLARQATDMRKGCASLAAIVENAFGQDPYAGDLFVFIGKHKNRVKIVAWDRSGFWLCAKRLEQGTFAVPTGAAVEEGTGTMTLSPAQIQMLLEGIDVHRATYHAQYHRPPLVAMPTSSPSAGAP
jgi:transposase